MTQEQALTILKTGTNVFLTGEPGSGKTHTLNQYVAYLRERDIEPAITASTGIAATHIGGMTIHSWSGMGIKTKLDKYDLDKIASTEYIAKRVLRAKVLIIDEVSMLLSETLSMIDAVCREIKRSPDPFGGLQIILVGDFFQLPPIVNPVRNRTQTQASAISNGVKNEIKENNAQSMLLEESLTRFAYDSPAWNRANPIVCYLTEQYRQDDDKFLSILSARINYIILKPGKLSTAPRRKARRNFFRITPMLIALTKKYWPSSPASRNRSLCLLAVRIRLSPRLKKDVFRRKCFILKSAPR